MRSRSERSVNDEGAPAKKRSRRTNFLRNEEVLVLYEEEWWPARVRFKDRGRAKTYTVEYYDAEYTDSGENSVEAKVTPDRIQPR